MQKKSELSGEIDFLNNLNQLATVYQSISIMKMQQIRASVTSNRLYVDNLLDIFKSLKYAKNENLTEKPELLDTSTMANKPLATVIITANAKFHGDILRRIFDHFIKQYDNKGDLYVIGKIGRELIKTYSDKIKFQEFDISDLNFTIHDLKPILFHILQYKQIHVYYALFKNIVDQIPVESDIADLQKLTVAELEKERGSEFLDYIYEPSAHEITSFIHNNVVAMLLLQTVSETHLARLASRMNAMYALLSRVEENVKILKFRERRMKRSIQDGKQLERMAGIAVW
jgi:ATP synthase F1 gamma subunit